MTNNNLRICIEIIMFFLVSHLHLKMFHSLSMQCIEASMAHKKEIQSNIS